MHLHLMFFQWCNVLFIVELITYNKFLYEIKLLWRWYYHELIVLLTILFSSENGSLIFQGFRLNEKGIKYHKLS